MKEIDEKLCEILILINLKKSDESLSPEERKELDEKGSKIFDLIDTIYL